MNERHIYQRGAVVTITRAHRTRRYVPTQSSMGRLYRVLGTPDVIIHGDVAWTR